MVAAVVLRMVFLTSGRRARPVAGEEFVGRTAAVTGGTKNFPGRRLSLLFGAAVTLARFGAN